MYKYIHKYHNIITYKTISVVVERLKFPKCYSLKTQVKESNTTDSYWMSSSDLWNNCDVVKLRLTKILYSDSWQVMRSYKVEIPLPPRQRSVLSAVFSVTPRTISGTTKSPLTHRLHLREGTEIKEIWRAVSFQLRFASRKLQTWILEAKPCSSHCRAALFSKQSLRRSSIILMNLKQTVWSLALHQNLLHHLLPYFGGCPLQRLPSTPAGNLRQPWRTQRVDTNRGMTMTPGLGTLQLGPSRFTSVRPGPWDASTDQANIQSILYTVNLWQQVQKHSRLFFSFLHGSPTLSPKERAQHQSISFKSDRIIFDVLKIEILSPKFGCTQHEIWG